MQISCCCDQSLRFDFFGRSKVPPVRRGGWTNGRRARTGGEASTTENPEDGYKEDQSTSHAVTDHDIFLPRSGAIVKGSLFPNSVPSAFSWLVKSLSACLPFALNSSENALNLPFLDAFLEIGSLVCGDFAFANPEGDFNTPFLPVHLQGDERAASLFCCTG
jgi:hypothetical protein